MMQRRIQGHVKGLRLYQVLGLGLGLEVKHVSRTFGEKVE